MLLTICNVISTFKADLRLAVQDVQDDKLTISASAKLHKIPRRTLYAKVRIMFALSFVGQL